MGRLTRSFAWLMVPAVLATSVAVADELPLTKRDIVAVLSGRTAISTDPSSPYRQYFDPNGTTIYVPEGGPPDPGRWRVEGDRYCSQWRGGGWDCYDMTGEGDRVTWIWPSGGATYPARMVDGNALK